MCGLTTTLIRRAARTFLMLAYPGGPETIAPNRRAFLDLKPDQPLEPLLVPPLCEVLRTPQGVVRGYAFRLGSAHYPHLKLQLVSHRILGAHELRVHHQPHGCEHVDRAGHRRGVHRQARFNAELEKLHELRQRRVHGQEYS